MPRRHSARMARKSFQETIDGVYLGCSDEQCEQHWRHSDAVSSALFSPDGTKVVSGSYDDSAYLDA